MLFFPLITNLFLQRVHSDSMKSCIFLERGGDLLLILFHLDKIVKNIKNTLTCHAVKVNCDWGVWKILKNLDLLKNLDFAKICTQARDLQSVNKLADSAHRGLQMLSVCQVLSWLWFSVTLNFHSHALAISWPFKFSLCFGYLFSV